MASRLCPNKAIPLRAVLLCFLLVWCAGCSPWLQRPSEVPLLPAMRASPESVALDLFFVNVGVDDRPREQNLWQQFDEQLLPVELRRTLNANGLRAGMIGAQIPTELLQMLEKTLDSNDQAPSSETITGTDAPSLSQRRLEMVAGRRAKVVVSPTIPTLSVLSLDETQQVVGQQFTQAQCLFSLKAYPAGDGSTRVELTPEIEHGEMKNRWVPASGALVQQLGKDRKVFEKLRLECELKPGQTLVLGPTAEPCGVGQPFFSVEQPTQRRILLLIRLSGSEQDDLFAPRAKKMEISTATE
jgi:hypothetical protein